MSSHIPTGAAAVRREQSRRRDGKFGEQAFDRAIGVDLEDGSVSEAAAPDALGSGQAEQIPLVGCRDLKSARSRQVAAHLEEEGIAVSAFREEADWAEMGYSSDRSTVRYRNGAGQVLEIEHHYQAVEDGTPDGGLPTDTSGTSVLAEAIGQAEDVDGTLEDYVEQYGYDPEVELELAEDEYTKLVDEARRIQEFLGSDTFARLRAASSAQDR